MTREKNFKIQRNIFIIYLIIYYHWFWFNIGKNGFDFLPLVILFIIIIVSMIADGLLKQSNLSRALSISMTIFYGLPFIGYLIMTLIVSYSSWSSIEQYPSENFVVEILVIALNLLPWVINSILAAISIFLNNKISINNMDESNSKSHVLND